MTGIPIGVIFYRALVYDGSLDAGKTIISTLLLGIAVAICSTMLALPLAFLTVSTKITEKKRLDIVLQIPFMKPLYIATICWILFT